MKRAVSALVTVVVAIAGLALASPALAWDSGNADGTQPVLAGDNFTMCAIRESAMIYCWGANGSGQLGRGTGTTASTAVAPVATYDSSLAISVASNNASMCALIVDHTVQCWGNNTLGMVGNGTTGPTVDTPTPVSNLNHATSIAVGFREACATRQDGTLWCWGNPQWTAFTGFPTTTQTIPVKVTGVANVTDISIGELHACALRSDKHVVCWGDNSYGQLGDGTYNAHTGVVVVPGITDATAVVVGYDNTCAIRAGGAVYCWGNNALGALGAHSVVAKSPVPLKVYGISGATSLSMQSYGGCVDALGVVKCWGSNDLGRLGDGQFVAQNGPVKAVAASLPKPTAAWTSYWGSCEIGDGGRVWCWGNGSQGRLGNNSTSSAYMGTGPGDTFGYAADPTNVTILNSAPGKPTGSSTTAKKIRITWAAPSTASGASVPTDYIVQYRLKGSAAWHTFTHAATATRAATVSNLSSGKYYQFRVYPKNWAGTGTVSAISSYIKSR